HPAVLEAAAVGVPHPSKGEVVKAFVVLRPGMKATAQELMDHCRANLAPYKVPVEITFRSELPKTLIGKVLRRQLAAEEPEVTVPTLPRAGELLPAASRAGDRRRRAHQAKSWS